MQKTIIEEVHEWASKQAIKLPITKEFVGEIIERGNQAILKEHLALCRMHVVRQEQLMMLILLNKELSLGKVH